jgi:hypothetical protein
METDMPNEKIENMGQLYDVIGNAVGDTQQPGLAPAKVASEKPLADQLEAIIDRHGLSKVLFAMGEVCHLKAAHIAENWQDTKTAKVWEKDGMHLDVLAAKVR